MNPDKYTSIVSTTTRKPREGEVNGKDYNFVNTNEFILDDMLQSVEFAGNYYGTGLDQFNKTQPVGLFIVTPIGIRNTLEGLNKLGYKHIKPEIIFFLNSDNKLKVGHNIDESRLKRGNIRHEFIKSYNNNDFNSIPVRIITDEFIDESIHLMVDRDISE
jgi:guanylate kinase